MTRQSRLAVQPGARHAQPLLPPFFAIQPIAATGQARYSPTMSDHSARHRHLGRHGLWYSLALCLLILLLGGAGFWILEPRTPTLNDAMWLAFTTAATVGYGDLVPTTLAARAFAVIVVLLGLAVLSLVTASLAAMFVGTEEREVERDLMREIGLLRVEVRHLRREVAAATGRQIDVPTDAPPEMARPGGTDR